MTIKEIAELANVSVATVSRIINNKDDNISEATRQRVLGIIKEYNYVPYAKIRSTGSNIPYLIGILVDKGQNHENLMSCLITEIRNWGYSSVVCLASSSEEELENLRRLCSYQVKGILWDRSVNAASESWAYLAESGIPYHMIDCSHRTAIDVTGFDFSAFSFQMTELLIEKKHNSIICLSDDNSEKNQQFFQGFGKSLFEHHIPFEEEMTQVYDGDLNKLRQLLYRYTAVVCSSTSLAEKVSECAAKMNIRIPDDLSVAALEEGKQEKPISQISALMLPYEYLGKKAAGQIVKKIEGKSEDGIEEEPACIWNHMNSITSPVRSRNIVVVGTINMDTILRYQNFPETGETVTAKSRALFPGGKGMNQAIGASRLGADVYLIGKLGKDYDGSVLFEYMKSNRVKINGISTTPNADTGHAYVYVQEDGESSIGVYEGANCYLTEEDIQRNEDLFSNASFCLIQTELPISVAEYAAVTAKKHGVKVLLKPCAVDRLSDTLLKNVDVLMPNKKEIRRLLPELETYEQQAQYFIDKGVETVIITLGHRGCYLRSRDHSEYFNALEVDAVDTTGAADAFAATLAVYLTREYKIETAVRYATVAAGLSTTRHGVTPALVEQSTLDMYFAECEQRKDGRTWHDGN